MTKHIESKVRKGVALITLNRPEVKNALNSTMLIELIELLKGLGDREEVRVVVLQGRGADFSSGVDIEEMTGTYSAPPEERAELARASVTEKNLPLFRALNELPQPVIASVRGCAIGIGLQMVLLSDLVIASETAYFALPQIRLGLTLDHGESYLLPRKIGFSRAMQLALLGEKCSAMDAEKYGIVNWVTRDEDLEAKTNDIVTRLAESSRIALWGTKGLLRASHERSLSEQFEAERNQVGLCVANNDFLKAIQALREKIKPPRRGE